VIAALLAILETPRWHLAELVLAPLPKTTEQPVALLAETMFHANVAKDTLVPDVKGLLQKINVRNPYFIFLYL
jgi:hypothetical protein